MPELVGVENVQSSGWTGQWFSSQRAHTEILYMRWDYRGFDDHAIRHDKRSTLWREYLQRDGRVEFLPSFCGTDYRGRSIHMTELATDIPFGVNLADYIPQKIVALQQYIALHSPWGNVPPPVALDYEAAVHDDEQGNAAEIVE